MPQSITLQADLDFRLSNDLGGRLISVPAGTVLTFPGANDLDSAAVILAGISHKALADNISEFNREEVVDGISRQVTYGPGGEKLSVAQGAPPTLVSVTVEDAADTIIVATFSEDINSPGANFLLGFSCKVNAVARVISAAVQQANHAVVKFTLASAVLPAQAVLLSYDNAMGDVENAAGAELQSFTDTVVINNVV